jgi:chemotaxis protein MotB
MGKALRLVSLAALVGTTALGCGYSEEEWQGKLREIQDMKNQLSAEQSAHGKTKKDLDETRKAVERLENQLRSAGADISNLEADKAAMARALEDYRRRAEQLEAIKKRFETLRNKLESLTKLGLKVTVRKNRMVIQLPGDVLFDTGRETLKKEGEKILGQVAQVIREDAELKKRSYQVAGHTDSDKLVGGKFKDNWGLSVMRAREVLAFLVGPQDKGGGGLDPERWSASGYGETDPVKLNDTPENKQANRRCELVVLPNVEEMLDLQSLAK